MFRRGLALSAPNWIACSNPKYAKITPPVEIADKTPYAPKGANPPAAVKFELWNDKVKSAITVTEGMAIFQSMIKLLDCASQRTPSTLMTVNTSINATATT